MDSFIQIEEEKEVVEEKKIGPLEKWKKTLSRPFQYDRDLIPPEPDLFTAGFLAHREDRFVMKNRDTFFTSAQRSLIVREIMSRTRYDSSEVDKVGFARLQSMGVFKSAYPLHDGSYKKPGPKGEISARMVNIN